MSAASRDSGFGRADAARLEALLEAAVDAIVSIDERGVIIGFNAAAVRLFGYAADEVMGRPVTCLMPEPYRSEHDDYLARYLAEGRPRIIGIGREVEGVKRSGERFPLWLSVGEARTGGVREFVGIMRDLSEQKAQAEQRRALEARLGEVGRASLLGEMAGGIAHEINQPLAAIANYAEGARRLLERGDADSQRLVKACQSIGEQAARAASVIENLRGFIRRQAIDAALLDVNDVVEDVLALIRTDTNEAGIRLTVELAEDLLPVLGNATQLQQVLLNLTRNAVDAMAGAPDWDAGIVVRTALDAAGRVELSVRDHGPGVSPDLGGDVFHPFVTTKPHGLGVGLAISRTLVEAHGGTLRYRPNSAGGAVFVASLPPAERPDGG